MKTTIARRIVFPFLIVLIFLIGVIVITYQGFKAATVSIDNMELEDLKRDYAGNLRFNITQLVMSSNDYILSGQQRYKSDFDSLNNIVNKIFYEFNELPLLNIEKQLLIEIKNDLDSIRSYSNQIFSIPEPRLSSKAIQLMEIMDYHFGERINRRTTLIFDGISERDKALAQQGKEKKVFITQLLFGTALLSLFVTITVAFLTIRRISKPIVTLAMAADSIANGDYSSRLEFKTNDEVALLAKSFSIMTDSIQQSQKVLQESKLLTEAIVETVPIGLLVFCKNGAIKSINNSFCNIFNVVRTELLGKNIMAFVDGLKLPDECCSKMFASQSVCDAECHYTHPAKGARILNLTMFTLTLTNDEILLFVEDITQRKLNEQIVVDSEKHFRTLIEHASDAIVIINSEGRYIEVNSAGCNLTGYTRDEIIQMSIEDLVIIPKENPIRFEELREGKSLLTEREIIRKDGSLVPVEISSKQMPDGNFVAILRDITERKRANLELLKLSAAVEQSPVLVVITDKKGKIEFVNNKFVEVSGFSREEVIGKNPSMWQSGYHDKLFYTDFWGTILAGKSHRCEMLNKKKNGEFYWESSNISPLLNKEGEITHFVAVKEDITDKKKMIEELILAKEKAEEMNRLKSNFLANMSHELRTPLNGILGYSDLLTQQLSEPELIEMSQGIYQSGRRLSETLNFILDLSAAESDKIEVTSKDIAVVPLVKNSINSFSKEAAKRNLRLETIIKDENIYAHLEEHLFIRILYNLLDNAIKFTKEGKILVEIGKEVIAEKEWLYIKIKDTGIGLAYDKLELIWDEFRQVSEGLNRSYEGTGLGLTISKRAVELMHGVISVESKLGVGSTFTVKFPAVSFLPQKEEHLKESRDTGFHHKKEKIGTADLPLVLCVEDDYVNSHIVKLYLKNICRVDTVLDGETAVKLAAEIKFDLILMDINLGEGMNGIGVVKEILKMPQYTGTPIIAVTAYAMGDDKVEFLKGGCTDYISKPYQKEELINLVTSVLKNK